MKVCLTIVIHMTKVQQAILESVLVELSQKAHIFNFQESMTF